MTGRTGGRADISQLFGTIRSTIEAVVYSSGETAVDGHGSRAGGADDPRGTGFDGGSIAMSAHLVGVDPSVLLHGVIRGTDRAAARTGGAAVRADRTAAAGRTTPGANRAAARADGAAEGESDA